MLLRPHQWVRGRWPWGYGSVLSIIIIVITVSQQLEGIWVWKPYRVGGINLGVVQAS